MTAKPRLIQKYNNRRLYDTLEHRYITLQDVHQLVLNNVDFTVLDRQTRTDITTAVLLDVIITAHSVQRHPALNREFLIDVIHKYCVSGPTNESANDVAREEYVNTERAAVAH